MTEKGNRNSPSVVGQLAQRTYFLGEQTGDRPYRAAGNRGREMLGHRVGRCRLSSTIERRFDFDVLHAALRPGMEALDVANRLGGADCSDE